LRLGVWHKRKKRGKRQNKKNKKRGEKGGVENKTERVSTK